MVYLYAIDISALPEPKENPAMLLRISSRRREEVMKYMQADDRKRCLGAGLLLAEILPLYGESCEKITYGPKGKPQAENVHFNLSHSGNLVICAVGEEAVGCDIEKTGREPEGVAKRFFHRNEAQYLKKFQGTKRDEMLFRLWTWKESYVKMTGEGLRVPFDRVCFLPPDLQKRKGKDVIEAEGFDSACRHYLYLAGDLMLALTVQWGDCEGEPDFGWRELLGMLNRGRFISIEKIEEKAIPIVSKETKFKIR